MHGYTMSRNTSDKMAVVTLRSKLSFSNRWQLRQPYILIRLRDHSFVVLSILRLPLRCSRLTPARAVLGRRAHPNAVHRCDRGVVAVLRMSQ